MRTHPPSFEDIDRMQRQLSMLRLEYWIHMSSFRFRLWDSLYGPALGVAAVLRGCHSPCFYMLVYQYVTRWKTYIWVSAVMGAVFAFLAEPLLVALGIYIHLFGNTFIPFRFMLPCFCYLNGSLIN